MVNLTQDGACLDLSGSKQPVHPPVRPPPVPSATDETYFGQVLVRNGRRRHLMVDSELVLLIVVNGAGGPTTPVQYVHRANQPPPLAPPALSPPCMHWASAASRARHTHALKKGQTLWTMVLTMLPQTGPSPTPGPGWHPARQQRLGALPPGARPGPRWKA